MGDIVTGPQAAGCDCNGPFYQPGGGWLHTVTCALNRPLVATTRQLTGTPYLHHAYVYWGGQLEASCLHRHGERGRQGHRKAQACAGRMLRRVRKRLFGD